jgi:hypothetical protein
LVSVIAMPLHSIDYLNARAARLPASGGTNYRRRESDTARRSAAEAAAERDSLDVAHDTIIAIFADFRAFLRDADNRLASLAMGCDQSQPVPF